MVAGTVSTEVAIKVPVDRVWKAMKDSNNLFPKAMPEAFASVETVEGDGQVGSVRLVNFGPDMPHKYAKEKLESVDEDKHCFVLTTVEGGPVGTVFSSQKITISIQPRKEEPTPESVVTWSIQYDALIENPPLDRIKANAEKIIKGVEAYLTSNDEYQ